ncbi:DUF7882 family protein [Microbacterium oleivorans]|uniref:ATP-dependent DNA ligase n=1 Tax=Microbacterium oleivorans TaxID=273677 RepID=A0A7D5F7I5_9MICO|nr:ATP-dependent DNA ligase [Microbacterium oleivorans]QLD10929.1 ATP-dependent DNA ligase [Microbacterium oleivorans]
MGKLIYEGSVSAEFEDRLLAHIQFVTQSKLRRGEPFILTWTDHLSLGGGRSSVWIHPHASLLFKFHGSRVPELNPHWLTALSSAANSPRGLYAVREPAPPRPPHTVANASTTAR